MSPYIVAITGGIGSGKSTVAELFEAQGVKVIDSDALSHQLTGPAGAAIPAIRAAFGDQVIDAFGALDRGKMRGIVFTDLEAKGRLEAILHPMIRAEASRLAAAASGPYSMYMVPFLVEAGGDPHERFNRVLVVDCPEEEQIRRAMARDHLARHEVEAIMANQASRSLRLAYADDVIDNSGTVQALAPQVEQLHRFYTQLAPAH